VAVEWEQRMTVGVEEIGARHRQILRRVRHLVIAVSAGHADEIRAAMRYLHTALAEHHALEEAWMSEAGYPAAREHGRAHTIILERLAAARADAAPGAAQRLASAVDDVVRMLEEHMQKDDLKLVRFWTARENLRRLAEAGPGVGMILTPIPGTLAAVVPALRATAARTPAGAPAPGDPGDPVPPHRK
jgi:hemerythrin-like metal-binding protein